MKQKKSCKQKRVLMVRVRRSDLEELACIAQRVGRSQDQQMGMILRAYLEQCKKGFATEDWVWLG